VGISAEVDIYRLAELLIGSSGAPVGARVVAGANPPLDIPAATKWTKAGFKGMIPPYYFSGSLS
jgi:hypothetical protein